MKDREEWHEQRHEATIIAITFEEKTRNQSCFHQSTASVVLGTHLINGVVAQLVERGVSITEVLSSILNYSKNFFAVTGSFESHPLLIFHEPPFFLRQAPTIASLLETTIPSFHPYNYTLLLPLYNSLL